MLFAFIYYQTSCSHWFCNVKWAFDLNIQQIIISKYCLLYINYRTSCSGWFCNVKWSFVQNIRQIIISKMLFALNNDRTSCSCWFCSACLISATSTGSKVTLRFRAWGFGVAWSNSDGFLKCKQTKLNKFFSRILLIKWEITFENNNLASFSVTYY